MKGNGRFVKIGPGLPDIPVRLVAGGRTDRGREAFKPTRAHMLLCRAPGVPPVGQSMISTFLPNVLARFRQSASVDEQRSVSRSASSTISTFLPSALACFRQAASVTVHLAESAAAGVLTTDTCLP